MGKEARSWDGPFADWPARRQRRKAGSCAAARGRGRPRTLPIVLLLAIVALCVPRTSLAADVPLLEDAVYHTDAGLLTLTAAQDLDAFGVDGLSVQDVGLASLALPRIGCGLDKLSWPWVQAQLEDVFASSAMSVTVYSLE